MTWLAATLTNKSTTDIMYSCLLLALPITHIPQTLQYNISMWGVKQDFQHNPVREWVLIGVYYLHFITNQEHELLLECR